MPNITLCITDETKRKMGLHPEIKWSNAVRTVIERKLRDFEEAEELAGKSGLTERDVMLLSERVNNAMGKHAKRLLNESRC